MQRSQKHMDGSPPDPMRSDNAWWARFCRQGYGHGRPLPCRDSAPPRVYMLSFSSVTDIIERAGQIMARRCSALATDPSVHP